MPPKDEGSDDGDKDEPSSNFRRRRRAQHARITAAAITPRTLQTTIATMPCVERLFTGVGFACIAPVDDNNVEPADTGWVELVAVAMDLVAEAAKDVEPVTAAVRPEPADAVAVSLPAMDCTLLFAEDVVVVAWLSTLGVDVKVHNVHW